MNDVASLLLWNLGRTTLWLAVAAIVTALILRFSRPTWPAAHRLAWLVVLLVGWSFIRLPLAVPWYEAQATESAAIVEVATDELLVSGEPLAAVTDSELEAVAPSNDFPSAAPAATAVPAIVESHVIANRINWSFVLLAAWAVGALVLVAGWTVGYVMFVRSLAVRVPAAEPYQAEWREMLAAAGVGREIPLCTTESCGPLLCRLPRGFEIIVPEPLWRELTSSERTAILRHELAHYERGDVWTSLVARLLALPHWFNPAAWWAARQFDEAAEWACDRAAAGDDATTDYASALVRLGQVGPRATFYGTAARGRSLAARIRRVLAGPSTEDSLMKKASLIALVLGLAAASVVQIELVAQEPAGEEKTAPSQEGDPRDASKGPTTAPYLKVLQSKDEAEAQPAKIPPADRAIAQNETKTMAAQGAAQKMVDEAKAAYEANLAAYHAENVPMHTVYDWSLRWMRAAQIAAAKDVQNTAAIQAHLDRMRDLQKKIAKLYIVGTRGGEAKDMRATNFYVAEAERWLAEAGTPAPRRGVSAVPDNTATPGSMTFDLKIKIANLRGELAQAYIDLQKTNRILDRMNKAKPGAIAVTELARWKADAQKLDVRLETLTEQLQLYENKLRLVERSPKEHNALSELSQVPPSRPESNERETPTSDREGAPRREHGDPAAQIMDLNIAMSEIEKEISQAEIELKLAQELLRDKKLSATETSRLQADLQKAELQRSYLSKRLSLYQEKAKLLDTQLRDRPVGRATTDGKTVGSEPTNRTAKPGDKGVRFEDKDFDSWAEELRNELSSERRVKAIRALATFGTNGYGPQAAAVILEAGRGYPLWLKAGDPAAEELAGMAVGAFRMIPSKDSLPLVLKSMESNVPGERLFAVTVLPVVSQDRIQITQHLTHMLKDADAEVRQKAALGLIGYEPISPEFVATLREWLNSDDPALVSLATGAAFGFGTTRGRQKFSEYSQLPNELLPSLLQAIERPDPYGALVVQALERYVNAVASFIAAIESAKAEPGPRAQKFIEEHREKKKPTASNSVQ